jgi:phosphoribosylamine--glycine ligase
MGDPETQPILMRLKSDFFEVLMAATSEGLDNCEMAWDRRVALGVVIAAQGYPLSPRTGDAIQGLPKDCEEAMVFHAGTTQKDGHTVSSGGRVLCVTALADSVKQAQLKAYQAASPIAFDGMQMRRDIGHRAIKNG